MTDSGSSACTPRPCAEHGPHLVDLRECVAYPPPRRSSLDGRQPAIFLGLADCGAGASDHGQDIHFLHIESPEPDPIPLILTHGWPGSVAEFLNIIGPLADPRSHGHDPSVAFDLVIPSLPGFAFSAPLKDRGWSTQRTAATWATLMHRLGYERYGAVGNDAGSMISPGSGAWIPSM